MMRALYVVLLAIGLAVLAVGGYVLGARAGWLTPDDATLRTRYSLPASKFVDIAGLSIHYTDEGQGPPIVLLHGSYGSLRMWGSWATELTKRYRVIRFDRPPMGLSALQPLGNDEAQREIQIIDALTKSLDVDRFYLVGTSSAGLSVAAYAATHPERLRGVILSNIAVGEIVMNRTRIPGDLKFALRVDPWFGGYHPRLFWRAVMRQNFHDPAKVTETVVREWTELNNRTQRAPRPKPAGDPGAIFARTADDLAHLTAPTLLLWSEFDHEFPVETVARKALSLLAAPDKTLAVVADCGHMMPLECGPQSAVLAAKFFDRVEAGNR